MFAGLNCRQQQKMKNRYSTTFNTFTKLLFAVNLTFFTIPAIFVFHLNLFAQKNFSQDFRKEEIVFQTKDIQLSGTLFLPDVKVKTPAVVVLHGSGPDEGLGYKIYAEEFSKLGIATLVFDKRGSGKSGGDWLERPFEFLADDALAAVKYLQNRPEIDSQKVGIWGISQGGWTAAFAAARSREVAFVISVSGNGLSPTQQEMFHKDEMYKALGYSEKAQDTALKFWKLAFDWLVLVDEGKFPLPEGIMNSERSAASIGLNYNPLPDWEKIKQPVLLIHGENDKLSPLAEAITKISEALSKGGNENLTVKVYPNASHTMTTNKTGLEFDWEDNFAPDYFKFTTDWIKAKTGGENFTYKNPQISDFITSVDFKENGRYGKLSWYGQTYPQLFLMMFFPLFYFICFLNSCFKIFRENSKVIANYTFGILCLINFLMMVGFLAFIGQSIFPMGVQLVKNYSIPIWQKFLPLLGDISLILTLIFILQIIINKNKIGFQHIAFSVTGIIFIAWLYYWNFLGLWF